MQLRLSIGTNYREHFRGSWWVVGNNPFENVPFDLQVPSPSMMQLELAEPHPPYPAHGRCIFVSVFGLASFHHSAPFLDA
jgi:hypothetical protein